MKKTKTVEELEDKTKAITELRMCFQSICKIEEAAVSSESGMSTDCFLVHGHKRVLEKIEKMCEELFEL